MTAHLRSDGFGVAQPLNPTVDRPGTAPARGRRRGAMDRRSGLKPYRAIGKRLLDLSVVILTLPVTLPVILFMAVLVALDGGRPFYSQPRVGRDGRIFRMWKLRSMQVDAEAALESYLARNPTMRAEWDAHQKLRHDPRITPIGELLRRSSLDELPQIFNILMGDMSVVGPRPMMPDQQDLYPGRAYYDLRPGLTGLWQVTARNESVFTFRAACDSRYDRRLSLLMDLKIILFTFAVVLRGTGR